MTTQELYETISGSYEEALRRMMKDALVRRFALKFLNDPSFGELDEALARGETESAFRAAHTLKGVCMNLAFTELGAMASEMTELLRGGRMEDAKAALPKLRKGYEKVVQALTAFQNAE